MSHRTILFMTLPLILLFPPPPTNAASQDECAIWLCLPTGFGTGCGGAKSAFKKRIRRGKSPLPDFASCAVTVDTQQSTLIGQHASTMTSIHGYAAYIPPYKRCIDWDDHHSDDPGSCIDWEIVPEQRIKNTHCYHYGSHGERWSSPSRCSRTLGYAETYMDGVKYGQTYYW